MFKKEANISQRLKATANIQKACSLAQSLRYFSGKINDPKLRRSTSAELNLMIVNLEKTAQILKIKEIDCYNQPLGEIHKRVFGKNEIVYDFIFSLQESILRYLYATDFELFKNDLKHYFNLAKEQGKAFNESIRKIIVSQISEAVEEDCDVLGDAIYEIVEELKNRQNGN